MKTAGITLPKKEFHPRPGDMILYSFLDSDYIKGRVIGLTNNGKKAKIEIGICHRKSEDVYTDIMEVNVTDLSPLEI